jgi:hypothetical protein
VIQGGVIGGRRPPDRKEHFLKDFLGFRPIADDAGDQREQQAAVPIVELGQRLLVAGRHSLQKRDVGESLLRFRRRTAVDVNRPLCRGDDGMN